MENQNPKGKRDGRCAIFQKAILAAGMAKRNKGEILKSLIVKKTFDSSVESQPLNSNGVSDNVTRIEKESTENLQTSHQEKQTKNSVPCQKHQSHFKEDSSSRNHGDSSDRTLFRKHRFSSNLDGLHDLNYGKNEKTFDRLKSQNRQTHDSGHDHLSRVDDGFRSIYRSEHDDRINPSKDYDRNVNSRKIIHNSNLIDKRPYKRNPDFTGPRDNWDKKSSTRLKNPSFGHQLSRDSSSRHSIKKYHKQNIDNTTVSKSKEDKDLIYVQKAKWQNNEECTANNEDSSANNEECSTNNEECTAFLQTDISQDNVLKTTDASDCSITDNNFNVSSPSSFVSKCSVISNEFKDSNNTAHCINEVSEVSSLSDSDVISQTYTETSILSNSLCSINFSDAQLLLSVEEENFIPPPIVSENAIFADSSSTSSEKNQNTNFQNESLENNVEDVFSSNLDSEHLKAISDFITNTVKEHAVDCSIATNVVRDLNFLFRNHFEGSPIDCYGSYQTNLAIGTSDINLLMKPEKSVRNSFMYEVYKILSKELEKYHVHPFEEGETAHKSKINFIHPKTGVNCQLAYLGRFKENILEMGKFLKRVCADKRVRNLIIAVKVWAEHLNINEVEDGKLHPIGYALLVIHFLQHIENPILPVNDDDCEQQILPENHASIGELWIDFLRYYSVTFNWKKYIVTVNSKTPVSKQSKNWENFWIAIEDPFSGKNIAESILSSDVADYIIACFKSSYLHFANPQVNTSSGDRNEESSGESYTPRFEFSFQKCLVEQDDKFCEMCDDIDDVCDECKKKIYVQPMATVPKMTDSFLKKVKEVLSLVYDKYMLSEKEIEERKLFVETLQKDVQKIYCGAQLKLFGSTTNGFGFKNSDLDICIMLKDKDKLTSIAVLKDLRLLLRKKKDFDGVIAIFNASIPILKFHYKPKGWRGDISLTNTLAIHNSELLKTYSLIDERCKILGCAFKLLAKKALISEVTDKALSSYSYLILVIHFLQQIDPPVLPILQDNVYRRNDFQLEDIVEDCNVWFCKDISFIKEVFQTKNDTPVEQLFLELLDYYCSFDYNKFITIRQKEIQLVGEKQRLARLFNIQDPFIETKNLGCVVSAKKAQETKGVLTRARNLFRTPINDLPSGVNDLEDYFFSTMSLTGKIHKEALCDLCGKFGHEQKECQHNSAFQFRKPFYRKHFFKPNGHAYMQGSYTKPSNRHTYKEKSINNI